MSHFYFNRFIRVNLGRNFFITSQWLIQERGPGGLGPLLFLDQTEKLLITKMGENKPSR